MPTSMLRGLVRVGGLLIVLLLCTPEPSRAQCNFCTCQSSCDEWCSPYDRCGDTGWCSGGSNCGFCGDTTCASGESCPTCPECCPPPPPPPPCNGNGVCDGGETCEGCPSDCCPPPPPPICNDNGFCDAGEDCTTCPNDNCCPPPPQCRNETVLVGQYTKRVKTRGKWRTYVINVYCDPGAPPSYCGAARERRLCEGFLASPGSWGGRKSRNNVDCTKPGQSRAVCLGGFPGF